MTAPWNPGSPSDSVGALLRDIRKRHRRSQAAIAARAGCDQSLVSYVEHDKRLITRELFSVYFELAREDPTMQRRLLLSASAAGAVGAIVGAAFLDEDALAQTWEAAQKIDVDWWHDHVAEIAADFVTAPAAQIRARIHLDLQTLASMGHPHELRAPSAKLLCMFARVQTDTPRAAWWMREAIGHAQTTEDTATTGWVYGRAALEASHGTDHAKAFTYADAAVQIAESSTGPLAQVGAFNALLGAAHAGVTAGQTDRARHYWEQSQYAYDRIDSDGEGDFGCTLDRMAINASHLLSRLGDESAEHWAAEAFGSREDDQYRTYRGIHQALRAHAVGDPAAASMAQEVIDAVPEADRWASLKRMATAAGAQVDTVA